MKKILVACEYSQIVTKAFRDAGASAWSCDIVPCTGGHPEWHILADVREQLEFDWDLVIAHPPCTYLAKSSAVALSRDYNRLDGMIDAREFFMMFTRLRCPTCIENPVPLKLADLPPYTQIVCPSNFGHKYKKKTCLWLYGLPQLLPMRATCQNASPWTNHCASNGRRRAHFWEGIAEAMAAQWLPII